MFSSRPAFNGKRAIGRVDHAFVNPAVEAKFASAAHRADKRVGRPTRVGKRPSDSLALGNDAPGAYLFKTREDIAGRLDASVRLDDWITAVHVAPTHSSSTASSWS